jgi:hypothetical protein
VLRTSETSLALVSFPHLDIVIFKRDAIASCALCAR